ncbi:MAG TPA: MFS transporter [Candidatus Saccharimonadales bacterium]|nr:MFS transporter [Candidatus Saccharimonadales bacterium]
MLVRTLGLGDLPSDFRRLWTATLASNLADGIVTITFALAAASLTTDPRLVAAVAVAAGIPPVVVALFAGAYADRVDRRRLMAWVQVLRVLVIATLAVVTIGGGLSLPLLVVGAFALSVGQTFYDTTAQAILPMVAGSATLTKANSRLYAAETLTDTFLGPPLGGALVAIGFGLAWTGAAIGYALALAGLLLLRGTFRVERTGVATSMRVEIAEGLRYLIDHRLQRTLTAMVGMGSFAGSAVFAVFVLYAVTPGPMGLSEVGYGLLLTASGAGSLLASAFVDRVERRFGIARTLLASQVAFGVAFLVPALTANVLAVGAAFVLSGVATMLWNVTNVSLRQRFIPAGLYGRVHAGHRLVNRGAGLAGAIVGGVLGSAAGLTSVFLLAAIVVFLSCLGAIVVNDRSVAAALAEAPPAAIGG